MPAINLYPWRQREPKRQKRLWFVDIVFAVIVAIVIVMIWYMRVAQVVDEENRRLNHFKQTVKKSDKKMVLIDDLKHQKRQLLQSISSLKVAEHNRQMLLQSLLLIAKARPDDLRISKLLASDHTLTISGSSLNNAAISVLMKNLMAFPGVKKLNLESLKNRNDGKIAMIEFKMTMEMLAMGEDNAEK
ncbi:MAG: PilN domain-containing protein [Francisellaceae bacterium]